MICPSEEKWRKKEQHTPGAVVLEVVASVTKALAPNYLMRSSKYHFMVSPHCCVHWQCFFPVGKVKQSRTTLKSGAYKVQDFSNRNQLLCRYVHYHKKKQKKKRVSSHGSEIYFLL